MEIFINNSNSIHGEWLSKWPNGQNSSAVFVVTISSQTGVECGQKCGQIYLDVMGGVGTDEEEERVPLKSAHSDDE